MIKFSTDSLVRDSGGGVIWLCHKGMLGAFAVTARVRWASVVGQALPNLGSRRPDVLPSLLFSSKLCIAFPSPFIAGQRPKTSSLKQDNVGGGAARHFTGKHFQVPLTFLHYDDHHQTITSESTTVKSKNKIKLNRLICSFTPHTVHYQVEWCANMPLSSLRYILPTATCSCRCTTYIVHVVNRIHFQ